MPAETKYISRENRAIVGRILMQEWDPIGVRNAEGAEDEYDAYVGEVYVMLMNDESEEAIYVYLLDIATGHMGLSPSHGLAERTARTAEKLVSLRPFFRVN